MIAFGVIRVFIFTYLLLQTYLYIKDKKVEMVKYQRRNIYKNHWSRHNGMLHRQYMRTNIGTTTG